MSRYVLDPTSMDSFILTPLSAVQTLSTITRVALAFGLLFALTYLVTYTRSTIVFTSRDGKREPLGVPYWLPFFGNLVSLFYDPTGFFWWTVCKYGFSTPLRLRLGPAKLYLVAGADHVTSLFKASKDLSPRFGVLLSLENVFGTPSDVIPFYKMDNSGINAVPMEGSNVVPEHRLNYFQVKAAQKHLSGTGLTQMTEHFMKVLRRRIHESHIGGQWTEMPDLYTFLQHEVFFAAVESLTGTYLLSHFPGFVDDFWEFDRSVPTLIKGLPHWLAPRPYKVRQRLLDAVKNWHKYARQHSDSSKTAPEDPEWDPLWGSKLMRAREEYSKGVDFMNEDALAAEDLGIIFAMNTNAVPAVAWMIMELYRDKTLLSRAQAEVQAAHRPTPKLEEADLDIVKLCSSPLLQSAYAETLRLRVAILLTRTPEREDFHMGQWTFPKGRPILFSSRTAALNPEIWNAGTAQDPRPLEHFCADRFLVSRSDPMSGPSKKDPSQSGKAPPEMTTPEKQADTYFSMERTAPGWLPYGGGQRMCPGRHFAKQEIIGSFAILSSHYDIELLTAEDWVPRPDMSFFPFGGLPPIGKVPFRIRRR